MPAFQLHYRGLTAGDGTDIQIGDMAGLEDLPELSGESYRLAGAHGSVPGQRWAGPRVITCDYAVTAWTNEGVRACVDAIKAAMSPTHDEHPLVVDLPVVGERVVFAVPTGRTVPTNAGLTQRGVIAGSLEWEASDPVLYGAELHSTPVPVFVGSGGLMYPVDYPKDYGAAGEGLSVHVPNGGDWPTWPRVTITGPSSGTVQPLALENTTDGTSITFTAGGGLTIPAGSTLIVDTHPARRVVRFTDGANRWNTVAGTEWWPIQPGGADLRFRATGNIDGVTAVVETRDAFL